MSDATTDADADADDLSTMEPNPAWDAASYPEAVDALGREGLTVRVWGGDWCGDCRRQLPDFAAALAAAGVPADRIHQYPVEKVDGEKLGPGMDDFDVAYIPTVVVERDGVERARFVEDEGVPIATYLADRLDD
jgi:thiol-disulfide isomerase/thioredoxin